MARVKRRLVAELDDRNARGGTAWAFGYADLAAWLGVKESTLRQWVRRRKLDPLELVARALSERKTDVDRPKVADVVGGGVGAVEPTVAAPPMVPVRSVAAQAFDPAALAAQVRAKLGRK